MSTHFALWIIPCILFLSSGIVLDNNNGHATMVVGKKELSTRAMLFVKNR